jgi:hypothetical protein
MQPACTLLIFIRCTVRLISYILSAQARQTACAFLTSCFNNWICSLCAQQMYTPAAVFLSLSIVILGVAIFHCSIVVVQVIRANRKTGNNSNNDLDGNSGTGHSQADPSLMVTNFVFRCTCFLSLSCYWTRCLRKITLLLFKSTRP